MRADTDIEQIKEKIVPVLREHDVSRSALFGSIVRGEATPESDVDILVEFGKEKSLLDLVGLQFALEDVLHKKVDVITYRSVHRLLKDIIFKEAVPIL
ncbi:hypothetical protein A2926_01225 [Candidatus Giovannonibacteria bacterium RIFCSPLOWO2_01_FULL_44_40]|uniref:Polymerase nucleotidyl transferase domain-containing protein n=1 Tax=Candidatus Giovannonibacteria bacterium RIFCSPHIGHO2_01_FULL_45_23 TaxID=1798325 RepID=A0A1F5VFV4_9BACT|nr:MAG: hypothetical protein A2834_02880 [Candidatus Giovannonibacteria bacterium RIFCSPHIGHO2_01_FULL_45_23]OGF76467.1 MAG: hypothetical protein A3C77_03930 [Candidatus Giovannonibacteria bacterium RIFCSPHIGHO2_02_FULL_45_13]OGF80138.1 MAG: hypothetical protein A2926_01225 [Candidatus Giovannonibacteria bacterium RIFCSPLOWO2_01_FULL_44_40]